MRPDDARFHRQNGYVHLPVRPTRSRVVRSRLPQAKKHPQLWKTCQDFRTRFGGRVHGNLGAIFTLRFRPSKIQVEIDFSLARFLVRVERLPTPPGVVFTTNPRFKKWPYPLMLPPQDGFPKLFTNERGKPEEIFKYLVRPHIQTFFSDVMGSNGWLSVDTNSVFYEYVELAPSKLADHLDLLSTPAAYDHRLCCYRIVDEHWTAAPEKQGSPDLDERIESEV